MLARPGYALLLGAAVTALLVLVLLYLAGAARTRRHRLRRGWRSLLAGADHRLSTSKTIVALWTLVVAWMLVTQTILATAQGRPLGDLGVGTDYLLLLGGPFASAVLAKGIVVTRLSNGTIQKSSAPDDAPLHTADLISDDSGRTDLVDFQYALFNLIALGIVVVLFAAHPALGMPNVPSGLLAVTSAAAAAYVGNKAVTARTPRVSRIDPGVARPGQAVTLVGGNLVAPGADPTTPTAAVTVNGIGAAVLAAGPDAVTVRIPVDATVSAPGQPAVVELVSDDAGLTRAQATVVVVADAISLTQVAPATAAPGAVVTLTGRGFLPAAALGPGAGVPGDPPVVLLAAAGNGAGGELARISPTTGTDTSLTFPMPALAVAAATPLTATVVRGLLSSGPLPLVLGALPVTPGNLPLAGPRSVDAAAALDYGDGVATVSGARRVNQAVTCTPPPPSGGAGWSQELRINLCETIQEIYDALDISVDTSASYGLASMSDKFSLAQSSQRNGFSLHLVALATVRSPLTVASRIDLTDKARAMLLHSDFAGFYRTYGDKFVSGLVVGGEYSAVLSLETSSDDARQALKNSLGATVQLGKLDASVQSEVTKTLNQFSGQLSMRLYQTSRGGSPAEAAAAGSLPSVPDGGSPTAPDVRQAGEIFATVMGFAKTVTGQTAQSVVAQLSNYSELDLPDAAAFVRFLTDKGGLYSEDGPLQELDDAAAERASLVADLGRARGLLRNPFGYTEPPSSILERFTPLADDLTRWITALDTSVTRKLQAVDSADPHKAHRLEVSRHDPVRWPTRVPESAYVIRSVVGDLVMSAPPGDGASGADGTLVLARPDPTDTRQIWLAPDLGTGSFRMRNAFTGRYVAHGGDSTPLSQIGNPDDSTVWTVRGWNDGVLFFPAGYLGLAVNAFGDDYGPGTAVGTYHIAWPPFFSPVARNFIWTPEPVTATSSTRSAQPAVATPR